MKADGTVDKLDDGRSAIRFERRLAHPVARVWAALTRPEELIAWWGVADVELIPGGRFDVRWLNTDDEGNTAEMHATISALEHERLLELDGDLHGVLRWELRPDGDGSVLSFTSTLELPEEYSTMVPAGWHFHLDALADALDGRSTDLVEIPNWEPIHAAYEAKGGTRSTTS